MKSRENGTLKATAVARLAFNHEPHNVGHKEAAMRKLGIKVCIHAPAPRLIPANVKKRERAFDEQNEQQKRDEARQFPCA